MNFSCDTIEICRYINASLQESMQSRKLGLPWSELLLVAPFCIRLIS